MSEVAGRVVVDGVLDDRQRRWLAAHEAELLAELRARQEVILEEADATLERSAILQHDAGFDRLAADLAAVEARLGTIRTLAELEGFRDAPPFLGCDPWPAEVLQLIRWRELELRR